MSSSSFPSAMVPIPRASPQSLALSSYFFFLASSVVSLEVSIFVPMLDASTLALEARLLSPVVSLVSKSLIALVRAVVSLLMAPVLAAILLVFVAMLAVFLSIAVLFAVILFVLVVVVVIGQEGEGLRELTKKRCDVLVSIPMAQAGICLNAADSALLMVYELVSRKMSK